MKPSSLIILLSTCTWEDGISKGWNVKSMKRFCQSSGKTSESKEKETLVSGIILPGFYRHRFGNYLELLKFNILNSWDFQTTQKYGRSMQNVVIKREDKTLEVDLLTKIFFIEDENQNEFAISQIELGYNEFIQV